MKSDCWLMDQEVLGLSSALCTLPTPEYGYQAMATVGYPESTEGRPLGQPLKKPEGAPQNLG